MSRFADVVEAILTVFLLTCVVPLGVVLLWQVWHPVAGVAYGLIAAALTILVVTGGSGDG